MWCLLSVLARASDAPLPLTIEDLPWQIQDEEKWTRVYLHSTATARAGGWVSIVSGGAVSTGALLLYLADETNNDALLPGGILLVSFGSVGALAGPPILLSASLRANRALREQGVYVSSTPAITGWTLYGLSIFAAPLFVVAWPVGPGYYATIVAAGFGQIETNRVGARNARLGPPRLQVSLLPMHNGLALAGQF